MVMAKTKKLCKATSKKCIFIAIPILIICLVVIGLKVFGNKGDDWQIRISDVPKECHSVVLHVYSDKDYVLLAPIGNEVVARGGSSYPKSIGYLGEGIKNYKLDKES